ncbi:hypothetical protein [Dermacoccus nishinomiyaensis]|uniref:hypothetical protein n=1 Tax=Dermacoccus nishinomiyaensis TaxID=1274 RepID=UPI001F5101D9|nr:hypothetical protein [Dermacoccus nishinomiyaensis]MCI0155074.1 hypothetical protein [Dermacoccus nishinomiyaensis]
MIAWVHARELVTLIDAPLFGRAVRLARNKRRHACHEPACTMATFVEQDETIAAPRALRTARAAGWALAQLRAEHASINAPARQLGVIPFIEGRPVITNNRSDSWETTDPKAFTELVAGKSRIVGGGRLEAVLQLLKYLRDTKTTSSIKSVLLTILVGNAIESWRSAGDPEYYGDIATALVHIIEDLNDYLPSNPTMPSLYHPSGTGRDFRERWDPGWILQLPGPDSPLRHEDAGGVRR